MKLALFKTEEGAMVYINPAHVISIKCGIHTDIITTGLTSTGTSRIYSVLMGAAEAAELVNTASKG